MTDLGACLVNDGEGVLGPGAAIPDVRQPHTLPHNSHHIQLQLIFYYLVQCFGSGSGLGRDSIRSVYPDRDPGSQK